MRFHSSCLTTYFSLERIQGYIDIEQEPKASSDGVPPAYWPSSGHIRAENLCAKYSFVSASKTMCWVDFDMV